MADTTGGALVQLVVTFAAIGLLVAAFYALSWLLAVRAHRRRIRPRGAQTGRHRAERIDWDTVPIDAATIARARAAGGAR